MRDRARASSVSLLAQRLPPRAGAPRSSTLPEMAAPADEHPFAAFVRTLGRGPGRSRALTRDEARDALAMILAGKAEPHQIGAFLMLLRYRGEDPEEVAGLVEAARAAILERAAEKVAIDLDWPS